MKRIVWSVVALLAVLLGVAWFEPTGTVPGWLRGEPFYRGGSAGYWRRQLYQDDPVALTATMQHLREDNTEVYPLLIHLLQRTSGGGAPEVRWRAAEMLGTHGDRATAAVPALLEALADPDPHVQTTIVRALGQIAPGDPAVVAEMTARLGGPLSLEALAVLRRAGGAATPARQNLLRLLTRADSAAQQALAAEVLGRIGRGDRAVALALLGVLNEANGAVRLQATEALGRIGHAGDGVVQGLVGRLRDPDPLVRQAAAGALGRLGPAARPALPAMRAVPTDKDPSLRSAIDQALRRIERTETP